MVMDFCIADDIANVKYKLTTICNAPRYVSTPRGLFFYSGSLYFAEEQGHVISKCNLAKNEVEIGMCLI